MKTTLTILFILVIIAACTNAIYVIVKGFSNAKENNRKAQLQKSRKLNHQLKSVN